MKKTLIIIALMIAVNSFAQLKEGTVTFKQTLESMDEAVQAQLAMMGNIQSIISFKDKKARTETSGAMIGKTVVIADLDSNKRLKLIDNAFVGKKFIRDSITVSKDKLLKVTKTEETKEVLGYTCVKYLIETERGKGTLYATEDIISPPTNKAQYGGLVTGFPLEVEVGVVKGEMLIIVKQIATKITKDKVEDSLFEMTVPDGFEETTTEKMKANGM